MTKPTISAALSIDGSWNVTVLMPTIGRGKPKKLKLVAFEQENISGMVRQQVRKFATDLIGAFHASHQHRIANVSDMAKLRALSELGLLIRTGQHKTIGKYKMILSHMEVLATTNKKSSFYDYDHDVVDFIRSAIPQPQNAIS